MSETDEIDGGETGEGGLPVAEAGAVAAAAALCLACGAAVSGPYCSTCGQKNDDLRRSSFILARDFLRDTFGFDSRMWRTLGLLAASPGSVPKDYAHGRRSRFTPPVRLFLVISFLFFLTIALTNTLFVGMDVEFRDNVENEPATASAQAGDQTATATLGACSFQSKTRFFVKESDLNVDKDRINACIDDLDAAIREDINEAESVTVGDVGTLEEEREEAVELTQRIFAGINWAVTNPRAFNDSINNWLPRILFLMTPVLALILTLFIRGKDALIFDHLVMSLYTHAAAFAVVALSLVMAHFGAPYMGLAAFVVIAIYYTIALKRTYGRGWIKTLWTVLMSGLLYLLILLSTLLAIMSMIVWRATG